MIKIADREVSIYSPPYFVAEISGNHCGKLENALTLIEHAKEAGADAVKFQAFTADSMTLNCDHDDFLIKKGLWSGRTLHELYRDTATPYWWFKELFQKAKDLNITIFSSVFDNESIDMLEKLDCPAYKIASFEITDSTLIRHAAKTKKPIIISLGTASLEDFDRISSCGYSSNSIYLACSSNYPADISDNALSQAVCLLGGLTFGLSDHTLGAETSCAAIALGACMIEKHIRGPWKCPDYEFSEDIEGFHHLVESGHKVWKAINSGRVSWPEPENSEYRLYRRSIYSVRDIAKGDILFDGNNGNIRSIRPGYGIPSYEINKVIGWRAASDIKKGTPLSWGMIDDN